MAIAVAAVVTWVVVLLSAFTIAVNVRGIYRNRRAGKELEVQTAKLAQLWAELVIEKSES